MADVIKFLTSSLNGSSVMRGEQMSAMMMHVGYKSECIKLDGENHKSIKGAICVVVKSCEPAILDDLRKQDNDIIYDVVDKFSRKEAPHETMGVAFADGIIATHKQVVDYFSPLFGNAKVAVIPHAYDPRFEIRTAENGFDAFPQRFRLGYLGQSFNHHFKEIADVLPVYDPKTGFEYGGMFTCHYSVRDINTIDALFKPATKASTAAACGANIITTRDPAVVDLIGEDYPFYVDEFTHKEVADTIKRAYKNFDKEMWFDGLDIMAALKRRTSIDRVAEDYIDFLAEFGLEKKKVPEMEKKRAKSKDIEINGVEV